MRYSMPFKEDDHNRFSNEPEGQPYLGDRARVLA